MEQQTENKCVLTKDNNEEKRVRITTQEAIEYREYKRQKKRAEILSAIANSEGVLSDFEDEKRVRERAMRLRQAAVCMSPERLQALGGIYAQRGLAVDCLIGGNGETIAKVKAYEAKRAVKMHASELTLTLSPYAVLDGRFDEIAKEIKLVKRAASKVKLKVRVNRVYPSAVLSRLARLCAEGGAAYFCVPYFDGCERIRLELKNGCKLQVAGVDDLSIFKKMHGAGVERILTTQGWEMYAEWMKEVEKINFPELTLQADKQGGERTDDKPMVTPLRLPIREPQKMLSDGLKGTENTPQVQNA